MTITERSLRLKRPWGDRSGRPQPGLSPIIRGGKEVLTPKAYSLRPTAAAALDRSPAPELLRVRIRRAHPRPASPPEPLPDERPKISCVFPAFIIARNRQGSRRCRRARLAARLAQ